MPILPPLCNQCSPGLTLAVTESVQPEYCGRTVVNGDVLAVEYEGSLDNGTVFDSSAAREAPFGPFTLGHGQIIAGYEQVVYSQIQVTDELWLYNC